MKRLTKVCEKCGSEEVRLDAWASWDEIEQQWALHATYDAAWCESCEGECRIIDRDLPDAPDTPAPLGPDPTDHMAAWEAMLDAYRGGNPALLKTWDAKGACEMRELCATITLAAVLVYNALTDDERETLGAFDWEYLPAFIAQISSFDPLVLPDPSNFQQ